MFERSWCNKLEISSLVFNTKISLYPFSLDMFKISEVILWFWHYNMRKKVYWVLQWLGVRICNIETEMSSWVNFHYFEVESLLFCTSEQQFMKRFDFDCSFLFYLIWCNHGNLIVLLNCFLAIDNGVDEMIFDEIFTTAFISVVLLLVWVVDIR